MDSENKIIVIGGQSSAGVAHLVAELHRHGVHDDQIAVIDADRDADAIDIIKDVDWPGAILGIRNHEPAPAVCALREEPPDPMIFCGDRTDGHHSDAHIRKILRAGHKPSKNKSKKRR